MITDPEVIAELRQLFVEGATPLRLARRIATRNDGEPWEEVVSRYFSEAFSVTLTPGRDPKHELSGQELLRDMVGRSHLWRSADDARENPAWWDGLRPVSASELELIDRLRPESLPALRDVWDSLPDRARSHVRQSMVNAAVYHEYATVLARLVESLQEQVVHLERERELVGAAG